MSLLVFFFFFLMIRRPPRSTLSSSSAASDVYKRQPQAMDGFAAVLFWTNVISETCTVLIMCHIVWNHSQIRSVHESSWLWQRVWDNRMSHFLVCICLSITAYFIDSILLIKTPFNDLPVAFRSASACEFVGVWSAFAANIAAMWASSASDHFRLEIQGKGVRPAHVYHLVCWGGCFLLGMSSWLWAELAGEGNMVQCAYYGSWNQKTVLFFVFPMVSMWLWIGWCLYQSSSFLEHYSTGT
eukprot:TRINITY_DN26625_c0_g1_i3.p2 TRINITY_DN26625_c0_g1~~TRINITY_DN26625_c0_g1_i3.p2  ORF type:complete len:241 (+),score=60.12 TRINITY_DN26625_c0_g1_i3:73-795(+)